MNVFLSYSRRDSDAAEKLISALRRDKHRVFSEDMISPGENIQTKINQDIGEADAVVVLLSESSLSSRNLQHEVAALALRSLSQGPKIYTLRIDKSPTPSYLLQHLSLDLSDDFELGLQKLLSALRKSPSKGDQLKLKSLVSKDTRASQLSLLREALRNGKLTLVCGAGISVAAGIPAWTALLLRLLERMMKKISSTHSLPVDGKAAREFQERNAASAPILGKYLKNTLGGDFEEEVRNVLYQGEPTTSDLINSIVSLSRPRRDGKPLDSILTYNFDGLIEENLVKADIPNKPIFSEAVGHGSNVLPIYHVHGYLPRNGPVPKESVLVFAEDGYHTQFIEPFSWSNLIQLNKWTENVCLFIGISLTDPNMRRLLDVAWRKNPDHTLRHFIIKVLPKSISDDLVGQVSRLLEEQDANSLGLNVIWVSDYADIPNLINEIPPVD